MAAKKPAAKSEPETTPAAPEDAPVSNDIDARMKALLKDHQRMGARPK